MHFVCIAFVAKATMKVLDKTTKRPDPLDGFDPLDGLGGFEAFP